MEHTALYRKYRPKAFKDVIGQDHIVNTLQNAISLGNIFHAYLFAGARGTGKTSVARIVASSIGATANDIYEIDAASNRRIDDIRVLQDTVATLPFESPYKVYIVDEVHMLTKEAFNALLKTLEEPPKHVVFILATTEVEKLPETIVSRCQVFQFKKPTREILKQSAIAIAKKEGCTLDAGAGDLIALLGDGSFRDMQGTLQKVISASKDKKISLAEVTMVTGAPKGEWVNAFVEALHTKDQAGAFKAFHHAIGSTVDPAIFLKLALEKIRFVLLLKYAPDMKKEIAEDLSPEDFALLSKIALTHDSGISSVLLSELLSASELVSRASIPALPIELALIRILGQNK